MRAWGAGNQAKTSRKTAFHSINRRRRITAPTFSDIIAIDQKSLIVGGESGPGARPMDERWVLQIKRLCDKHEVPFFFKQWGGVQKHKRGRILNDQTWDDMPALAGAR